MLWIIEKKGGVGLGISAVDSFRQSCSIVQGLNRAARKRRRVLPTVKLDINFVFKKSGKLGCLGRFVNNRYTHYPS